jgi:translation elongation factor EF-Ts
MDTVECLNTTFRISCLQQANRRKSATAAEGIITSQSEIKQGSLIEIIFLSKVDNIPGKIIV